MKPTDNASFAIYNASAGSGKTFLLVQKYLETLLRYPNGGQFQRSLALTFTNKAVFEMKHRILKNLNHFSTVKEDQLPNDPMAKNLINILKIPPAEFAQRSKHLLGRILHDYAAFDVITLDSFTHRIIRSFAKDLGLRSNFNVSLGIELMLRETVDDLVGQVGEDKDISRMLTQFTYARMDEGSANWDLKDSLFESAKLILNENDRKAFGQIASLTKEEKNRRFQWINTQHSQLTNTLISLGEQGVALCHENGLGKNDFSYGTLYNRFVNLAKGLFSDIEKGNFFEKLQQSKSIYPKSLEAEKKATIEVLLPQFLDCYTQAVNKYYLLMLVDDIRKQWISLSMLTHMAKGLEERQLEQNNILLSSFNERIAKEILRHPVPYIYERMGEHYRDYFLDEFQDTSCLQWDNLIPLVENALVSEDEQGRNGSLLLVGDPKQAIYRWRGGDVNQFIRLLYHKSPFLIKQNVEPLDINYRSAQEIVAFNNSLLNSLQNYLSYPESKKVFSSAHQNYGKTSSGGYVQLSFLPVDPEIKKPAYAKALVEQIKECTTHGYALHEMAVLVRKRQQAEEVATFLSAENLSFVSSDALAVTQSNQVTFLINTLKMLLFPEELNYKKEHLAFLYATTKRTKTLHQYLIAYLPQNIINIWKKESILFRPGMVDHNSIYTILETLCFSFPGIEPADPFVQSLLDCVADFTQKVNSSIQSFLGYWEKEGQFTTLSMSDAAKGIRVLTIHQAKGLEFPVVFYPYAEDLIHPMHRKRVWLETRDYLGEEFPLAWVNFSKRVEHYGTSGKNCYHTIRMEEEIDAWNTFYVAITRPVEQLYIFTRAENIKENSYPHFLQSFVERKITPSENRIVSWGEPNRKKEDYSTTPLSHTPQKSNSDRYAFEKKLILKADQDSDTQQSIEFGILFHELMAEIQYKEQYTEVLHSALIQGRIGREDEIALSMMITTLMDHPQVSVFYTREFKVLNERGIILAEGEIVRPDRIAYNEEKAVVIDYKTGDKNEEHQHQINRYCKQVSQAMKLPVEGYLVYLSKDVDVQIDLHTFKNPLK